MLNKLRALMCLFLAAWLVCLSDVCVSQDIHFTHLTTEHGLSSNDVRSVIIDEQGLYWIATANGLNIYDGHTITVMHHDPANPSSIPHDQVRSIVAGKSGTIWIGTDGGIARMNTSTRKCEVFRNDSGDPAKPGNYLNRLYLHNGQLYLQSHLSLWGVNEAELTFTRINICAENAGVYSFLATENKLIVGTRGSVIIHDTKTGDCAKILPINIQVEDMLVTGIWKSGDKNKFWVTTWENGLWQFNIETLELTPFGYDLSSDGSQETIWQATEKLERGERTLYLATGSGITRMILRDKIPATVLTCRHNDTNKYSISGGCTGIFDLKADEVWCSSSEGFNIIESYTQAVHSISGVPGNTSSYMTDMSTVVSREWFSTWDAGGIYTRTMTEDIFTVINPNPAERDEPNWKQVGNMIRAKDGSYWVATFGGVVHASYEKEIWKVLESWDNVNAMSLAEDSQQNIWIATYHHGIWIYDGNFHRWNAQHENANVNTEIPDLTWKIMIRRNGHVVVSMNYGVLIYDHEHQKASVYRELNTTNGPASLATVYDAYEDHTGKLWLSTTNGLFEFNDQQEAMHYTTADGLSDMTVHAVCEDNKKNLWVMCETAICKWRGDGFEKFSGNNGLPFYSPYGGIQLLPDSFITGADHSDGGFLILCNSTHPLIFDTALATQKNTQSHIHIYDLICGTLHIRPSHLKTTTSGENTGISNCFSSGQNDLRFNFAMPVIFASQKINYQYQLVGADEAPISSGHQNYANYTNLKPGTYTFMVWTEESPEIKDSFTFTIEPPFWQTWWFMSLLLISGIIIIASIVRYVSTRNLREKILLLQKQQAVEQERQRISRDMHDELGSGLTKISVLSEVAKSAPGKNETQLNAISQTSRDMVNGLQEIIWTLQPQNNTLRNLAAYIRENAAAFFEHSNTHLHVVFPENIPQRPLSDEVRRTIYLIMKESLNNIQKHANAVNAWLILEIFNDKIVFTARDDGEGFEKKDVGNFSNGLTNMTVRAKQIHAPLEITSKQDSGTSVVLVYFMSTNTTL